MKTLLHKTEFPQAPGGDRYEWKSAATKFATPEQGKYLIEITASAKNAAKNCSTDDDDLRIALDDYDFGKYEIHDEKVSWKGFGTASSWDGASLKGNSKTIYFFVELQRGKHILQFFADKTPTLQELKILQFEKDEPFELQARRNEPEKTDQKGIPWMSFIFLGVKPKHLSIEATTQSAAQKKSTDGDNLKVVTNGKIIQNPKAPRSQKYKNFYFSGDLNKGKTETITINPENFEYLEDSVELWYDQNPSATIHIQIFESIQEWLSKGVPESLKPKLYELALYMVSMGLSALNYDYSGQFLKHSLSKDPRKITFESTSRLAKRIKKDETYQQINLALKTQLKNGVLNGQIFLGDEKGGLKIEFYSKKISNHEYKVWIKLLDVYDFDAKKYDLNPIHNIVRIANELEKKEIQKNFEIEINIVDTIKI